MVINLFIAIAIVFLIADIVTIILRLIMIVF